MLLLSRVDKPALRRRLFELGCRYSGQILSYTKMLGQLQEAGNTTTLAHYLDLLAGAGMLVGLQKYPGGAARRRGSSPKLQALNTALMTAQSGLSLSEARQDREYSGRPGRNAVGAHLANAAATGLCELFYWRDRNREVDFVVRAGRTLTAIEVKSGRWPDVLPGLDRFRQAFRKSRPLLVDRDGIGLEEFLMKDTISRSRSDADRRSRPTTTTCHGAPARRATRVAGSNLGSLSTSGRGGQPIGIEIITPEKLSVAALNSVLRQFGFAPVKRAELVPVPAASLEQRA